MTMTPAHFGSTTMAAVRRWNARGDFLLVGYATTIAAMVLTNNHAFASKFFVWVLLPAALFQICSLLLQIKLPHVQLGLSLQGKLTFSVLFMAVLFYLLALNVSATLQPDLNKRLADQQWLYAGQILLFILITANAVARIDGFVVRLIGALAPIIAASALINVWVFLSATPIQALVDIRLINWLGMPGYTNSTNISLTYALFFVSAFAIVINPDRGRLLRWWLAPAAGILAVAFLLTQSRSALIGAGLGIAVAILLARGRAFWIRHGWKFAAMVLLTLAIVASSSTVRTIVSSRGESLRPEIWKVYGQKALEKPLKGRGGLANIDIVLPGGTVIDQPHNLVLSAQIRGGLFAMLAMLVILLGSLYWTWRYWLLTRNAIPLAMIVTVAATGMFDYNLLITAPTWPWVTFWLPFAICAGAEMAVRSAANDAGNQPMKVA